MGSSGTFGSVMTMPFELAATARSSRRRISSEAGRFGSLPRLACEEEVSKSPRILQPSTTPYPVHEGNRTLLVDVKSLRLPGITRWVTEKTIERRYESG